MLTNNALRLAGLEWLLNRVPANDVDRRPPAGERATATAPGAVQPLATSVVRREAA